MIVWQYLRYGLQRIPPCHKAVDYAIGTPRILFRPLRYPVLLHRRCHVYEHRLLYLLPYHSYRSM